MTCIFARHGQSEANVLKVFANEGLKYPLTELGIAQAKALALAMESESIDECFASPLLRAQQTATIVCERLGINYTTSPALKEFSVGDHEGACNKAAWEEYYAVENAWLIDGDLKATIGGGECYDEIAARFLPFIETLVQRLGKTETNVLCIGHGGTFTCMLPLILKNVTPAFCQSHRLPPTGYVKAVYQEDGFICTRWADVILEPIPAV